MLSPAHGEAKTFRHYYGMQWQWEPLSQQPQPALAHEDEVLLEARLLPTNLHVLSADFVVAGQLIIPAGEQLARAESQKDVRCTLGPAAQPSLADDRRVCVYDSDDDGTLDAWFDEGLGMEMGQLQFTGCLPVEPMRAAIPAMVPIDPAATRWPFVGRLRLASIHLRRDRGRNLQWYEYRLEFAIEREDKPALEFIVCSAGNCRIRQDEAINLRIGQNDVFAFGLQAVDATTARFQMLSPVSSAPYWSMTPGQRPDPVYCPGTLFVETDQNAVW